MLLKLILISIFWILFVLLVVITDGFIQIKKALKELARRKEFLDNLEEL